MLLPTKELSAALAAVGKFASGRTTNEAYTKVVLVAQQGHITVKAGNANGNVELITDIRCDDLNITVDHQMLSQSVRLSNLGEIDLIVGESNITIVAGLSKIKLPHYNIPWSAPLVRKESNFSVSKADWLNCATFTSFVGDDMEMKIANGQRLLSNGLDLTFISSTGKGTAGVSVECSTPGSGIDVVVPNGSIAAITDVIKTHGGDNVSLRESGGTIKVCSGNAIASLPTLAGTKPYGRDVFNRIVQGAVEWSLPRKEMIDFLRQAGMFTDHDASGIDMEPCEGGLLMKFESLTNAGQPMLDGKGSCSSLIPGQCSGKKQIIEHKPLLRMLERAGDDCKMLSFDRGFGVTSGTYFAMQAGMTRVSV